MKVYFSKLDNGDWICYDELNSTGDLYIDPEKIDLLKAMLPSGVNIGLFYSYDIPQELWVGGFGRMQVITRLRINTNGLIKNVSLLNTGGQYIGDFNSFVLDLPALPAFDTYDYPEVEEGTGDDPSKS